MLNKILDQLNSNTVYECCQTPERIYTNKELYKYICNIYNYLNTIEGKNIVVYGHKEIYMIASFIACACSGKTYIPIDRHTPNYRKDFIISKTNPALIIDESIEQIMNQENDNGTINENINIKILDDDIVYIIFTSGSTGEPKGVKITYKNLNSCLKWLLKITDINNGAILNQGNYSFDLSVADIYLSLLTRSKQVVLEKELIKDYKKLFEYLKKSNITAAVITPSFANYLLVDDSFNKELLQYLKTIIFCGENLHYSTVSRLKERFPDLEIINCYGPTECTFAVTSEKIETEDISIGIPKEDVKLYIVDENHEILSENEIGEIMIVGKSVGDGYINSDNKSFITYDGKKAYLTGDKGYCKNGKYYCIGREDKQVKYNGYRIELLEIEQIINKLEYINNAVVVAIKNENREVQKIVAFVEKNYKVDQLEIRKELKNYLPDYMIPKIVILDKLPLNENGKVNEKELIKNYNER